MSDVVFRSGWRKNDGQMEEDAKAFWRTHKAGRLPPKVDPDERARELCAIAYRDGHPIGVSTAKIMFVEQFRSFMAYYRCAVASEFGREPLSWRITDFSRETLERWSLEHPDEKVMGLMAVMQSKTLVTRYPQVFGVVNMTFTGFTQAGYPIRVAWFKHATIPTDWPPRPSAATQDAGGVRLEASTPVRVRSWTQ